MNDYNSCFDCGTYLGNSIGVAGRCSTCHQTKVIKELQNPVDYSTGDHIGFAQSVFNIGYVIYGIAAGMAVNEVGGNLFLSILAAIVVMAKTVNTTGNDTSLDKHFINVACLNVAVFGFLYLMGLGLPWVVATIAACITLTPTSK
jgi:hypothetical protein